MKFGRARGRPLDARALGARVLVVAEEVQPAPASTATRRPATTRASFLDTVPYSGVSGDRFTPGRPAWAGAGSTSPGYRASAARSRAWPYLAGTGPRRRRTTNGRREPRQAP